MKKSIIAAALAVVCTSASAEITANLTAVSDYRFRGISQTELKPTLQGGVDYSHASGFYLGNWNSGVSSDFYLGGKGIESDVYLGVKKEISGVAVDFGAIRYMYPGSKTGSNPSKYTTDELYVGAARGPVSAKVSYSVSDYFGIADSRGTWYYDLSLAVPVGSMTLVAHAGHTDVANQSTADYQDYKVGATTEVAGFTVGAFYHTNNLTSLFESANTLNGKKLYKDAVVVSITKTF
jgi:uncharacterized protein (TIGR02001 family)